MAGKDEKREDSPEPEQPKATSDPFAIVGAAIEDSAAYVLGKWGAFVASQPYWVVFLGLILAAALGCGMFLVESEVENANLWTPSGAQVLDDKEVYDDFFGEGFRYVTVYIKAQVEGGNVITPAVLAAAAEIDEKLRTNLTVTVDGETYGFEQICAKSREHEPCIERLNPTSFYNVTTGALENLPEIVEASLGLATKDDSGAIVSAETLRLTYMISRANDTNNEWENCVEELGSKGKKGCNPTLVFEEAILVWLDEYDANSTTVRVFLDTQKQILDIFTELIAGDAFMLSIAFGLLFTYAQVVLGKPHVVYSRVGVSTVGLGCVGLSVLGAYGMAGWAQVPQTPVTALLPFILVGIGVDDMFVLCGALDRTDPALPTGERLELMMRDAGLSITVTSLTDMCAFALGTITAFPALKYFCIYAAVGIVLDWLFQITIFVAFLFFDEERKRSRGMDPWWCAPCSVEHDGDCACCFVPEKSDKTTPLGGDMSKTLCFGQCPTREGGYLRGFISDFYAPALTIPAVKLAAAVVMITLVGLGISGVVNIKEEFSYRYFVPSNDPLYDVYEIADSEFQSGFATVQLLLDHRPDSDPLLLHDAAVFEELVAVRAAVEGFEWYEEGSLTSPMELWAAHLALSNETAPSDTKEFYDRLHSFLATDGSRVAGYFATYDWYSGFITWIAGKVSGLEGNGTVAFGGAEWSAAEFDADTYRPLSKQHFCLLLRNYLAGPGKEYEDTVVPALAVYTNENQTEYELECYPESGDVAMHRVSYNVKCRLDEGECPESNATASIEIMDGSREIAAELGEDSKLNPIAYSFIFTSWEQFKVVRKEILVNLGLALAAIAGVTLLLLGNPWAGLLTTANVCMVLLEILGLMWLWSVTLNSVSLINLILAIGIAVDYSAHIAHAFMRAVGTGDERMVSALTLMGADVTHGAVSTFLAVLVTAGSRSYVFQVFFRQFFGICLFGMLHGILFLPIILSLIGPPPRPPSIFVTSTVAPEEEDDEEKGSSASGDSSDDSDDDSVADKDKALKVVAKGENFGDRRGPSAGPAASPSQGPASGWTVNSMSLDPLRRAANPPAPRRAKAPRGEAGAFEIERAQEASLDGSRPASSASRPFSSARRRRSQTMPLLPPKSAESYRDEDWGPVTRGVFGKAPSRPVTANFLGNKNLGMSGFIL